MKCDNTLTTRNKNTINRDIVKRENAKVAENIYMYINGGRRADDDDDGRIILLRERRCRRRYRIETRRRGR